MLLSLSHIIHPLSGCLARKQQWLLTANSQWHSSIRKSGTMTVRPVCTTAAAAWLLAAGSMVEILLISPQTPDCHTPSSLKTRSSNRSDTEFFLKFLVPFSLIFLCSVGIIRKLRRGSRMQADNPGCRKPGFWWSLGRWWLALASQLVHLLQHTPPAFIHAPQL